MHIHVCIYRAGIGHAAKKQCNFKCYHVPRAQRAWSPAPYHQHFIATKNEEIATNVYANAFLTHSSSN